VWSLRIRLLGWRLLSLIALIFMVMAVFWHRQAVPPPVPQVVPPYAVPAVAKAVLTTADLPDGGRAGWLAVQDGPPTTRIFTGTGRLRADVRQMLLLGAWQRTWESTDAADRAQVRVLETRRNDYAKHSLFATCEPRTRLSVPGVDAAGYTIQRSDYAVACARMVRGRSALVVNVRSVRSNAPDAARRELSEIVRRQLPRVPDLPDRSFASWKNSSAHIAANSEAMSTGLGIPLLLGLIVLVRDRSSWRRLRSWFTRPDRTGVFWVDQVVAGRLAAGTAAVMLRLCVYAWTIRVCEIYSLGIKATVIAGLGAVAGVLTVEWALRRRRPARWRPAIFDRWWRLLAFTGVVVTAAIASAGVYVILLGGSLESLGVNLDDGADYVVSRTGLVLRVIGVLLLLISLLPFTVVRRLGMRRLRHQIEQDERRPTLMLRSFADDRRTLRARRLDRASVLERLCMRRFERFEEVAAAALSVHGPVVALSQVGEKMPPALGAVRRSFSMDDWKDRVGELIAGSQLICVTVGRSESLLWEIRQIRAAGALERTIFLLPPTSRREQRRRLAVLGHALGIEWHHLGWTRPGTEVLAVTFRSGHPVVMAGRASDDVGYESAVEIAALAFLDKAEQARPDIRAAISAYVAHAAASYRPGNHHALGAPRVQVFKPGAAPVYRPWWQKLRLSVLVKILSPLLSLPLAFVIGYSPSDIDAIELHRPVTALVEDQTSATVYAVLEGHYLMRLDFKGSQGHLVARVRDGIDELVIRGSDAYYASTTAGRIGHVDLRGGRTTWTRSVPGVRSLALSENEARVVVTSPVGDRVQALASSDGHIAAERILSGAPYGVALADGRVFVSLARNDQVVELASGTLKEMTRVNVPAGPRELVAQNGRVWVRSALAHLLQAIQPGSADGFGPHLLMSNQFPQLSGNGAWLAVQGLDRVTVVSPRDRLHRVPLSHSSILSLLVQRNGLIVTGEADGEIDRFS
jgi:hypothetical protein